MTDTPSSEEKVAFEVVRRVLGAEVDHYDTNGRQGAVDGLIHLASGRYGALEVTTYSAPRERELLARLSKDGNTWPNPGRWWWRITIDNPDHIKAVRDAYVEAILVCEAESATVLEDLPWRVFKYAPSIRWLLEIGITMRGHPEVLSRTEEGAERGVMVTPSGSGGGVDERLESLATVLAEVFRVGSVDRRARKVAGASGVDERHLFLILSLDALPFATSYGLTFGDQLPPTPPPLPSGVTHLWLATGYGRRVLLWNGAAWSQHHPYDN